MDFGRVAKIGFGFHCKTGDADNYEAFARTAAGAVYLILVASNFASSPIKTLLIPFRPKGRSRKFHTQVRVFSRILSSD